MHKPICTFLLAGLALGSTALAGENDKKVIVPPAPAEDSWQFKLTVPAWAPWMTGETGINGAISHIDLGAGDIIPRVDMTADVRAEAHKGRFSVMGEFLYMGLSDGIGTKTVVKKLDVQVDQTMADLGIGWRLLESERGYLDVIGGVRYNNLYQHAALQPNDQRIEEVVDGIAEAVGSQLRTRLGQALAVLRGNDASLPIAPLNGNEATRLAAKIAGIKGTAAERRAKVAKLLHDSLSRSVSRTDDWWDPYIGLRGRYNMSSACYLTVKGDIGGFGVGSDLSWTAEAALGFQLTRSIYSEIGYRALGVDYEQDGLVVDTVTHGPQLSLGIAF